VALPWCRAALFGVELPLIKTLVAITSSSACCRSSEPDLEHIDHHRQSQPGLRCRRLVRLPGRHPQLEYFLNARIVGSHINARAWELLLRCW